MALTLRSILKTGENVFLRQIGKIIEDFFIGHAGSQIAEHIVHGDSHSSNARLTAALARLDSDDISIARDDVERVVYVARNAKTEVSSFQFLQIEICPPFRKSKSLNGRN